MLLGQQGPTYYVVIAKGDAAPLTPAHWFAGLSVHRVKHVTACVAVRMDFTEFCWPLFEKSDETAVFFEKNYKNARRMTREYVLPSSFKTCSFVHFSHHLITWRGGVSAGK